MEARSRPAREGQAAGTPTVYFAYGAGSFDVLMPAPLGLARRRAEVIAL
jgi:hypothetical protein